MFPKSKTQHHQEAYKLPKLLRIAGSYVCGLCRNKYQKRSEAQACLNRCHPAWLASKKAPKTLITKEGTLYSCPHCHREHEEAKEAYACAKRCEGALSQKSAKLKEIVTQKRRVRKGDLHKIPKPKPVEPALTLKDSSESLPPPSSGAKPSNAPLKKPPPPIDREEEIDLDIEFEIDDVPPSFDDSEDDVTFELEDKDSTGQEQGGGRKPKVPPKSRRDQMYKYTRDGRDLYCRKCGACFKTIDEVIECYDAHPEKEKSAASADDAHKFSRDGAKYVCSLCQSKYFTKNEVVTCYDSHNGKAVKPAKTPEENQLAEEPESTPEIISPHLADDDKFIRDGAKYVCKNCSAKFFTRNEVIECFNGHRGKKAEKPAQAPTAPEESPPPDEPQVIAADLSADEKFLRDGAKYVCRKCGEKFFTRIEVSKCFDSH